MPLRAAEFRECLQSAGFEVTAMSASNCLSAAWGEKLTETQADARKWSELLRMELEACREPGCLDMGTYLIAVARKRGQE